MSERLTTRAELDQLRCGEEHCYAPLRLFPDCHEEAALIVEYEKGEFRMYCAECGELAGTYPVAG